MSTKHTPGPWWFAENQYCFAVGAGDVEIAHVGQTARQSVNLHDRSRSNARLIAAAPALLAALESALDLLEHARHFYNGPHSAEFNCIPELRAAIAAARGEG